MHRLVLLTVLLLLSHTSWAEQAGPSAETFAELTKALQLALNDLHAEQGFPGATAAVAFKDGRLIKLATGKADLEQGVAMTPDHRMPGGSTGKTYAAAVAVILEKEGLWDLDDRLADHVGDEPWFHDIPNQDTITLRQLLRHRSGVENWYDQPAFHEQIAERAARGEAIDSFDRKELIAYVYGLEPLFEPGKGFRYTDVGYILVGEAIEAATGRDYFDVLHEKILFPLGLRLTEKSVKHVANVAQGYAPTPSPLVPGITHMLNEEGDSKIDPELEFTGGGLVNNSGDMARWILALHSGGAISKQAAIDIQAKPDFPTEQENQSGNYYGLGVFVTQQAAGYTTYGHGGYFPGYRSAMQYVPKYGFSTAVQLNTEDGTWSGPPKEGEPERPSAEAVQLRMQAIVIAALNR